MSIKNEIFTKGDSNVSMQNITANDIHITIAENLAPEVKSRKRQIKTELDKLKQVYIAQKNNLKQQNTAAENKQIRLSRSQRRLNQNLIKALDKQLCVLFVGPEISVDEDNNSIHEEFYKSLCEDADGALEYDPKLGFFQPHSDPWFASDIQDFYSNEFKNLNKKGQQIAIKLASLPFKLIVSLAPDNTMKDVFEKFDLEKEFLFYDKNIIKDVKPKAERPVIFNTLGSAVSGQSDWQYIFTFEDFYNYIKNILIPDNVQAEIDKAVHYLFIGFDFEKFYYTLILFLLKLNNKDKLESTFRYAVEPEKYHKDIKTLLNKQFNITLIENDYLDFINSIINESKDKGIYIDLETYFIKKQLFLLKELADDITDAKTIAELKDAEKKLTSIKNKL